MIKIFSIFLDTRPFLEHFLKKMFFCSRKAENNLLRMKNEAVKVLSALLGMLAIQDTHGNSRGLEGPLGQKETFMVQNCLKIIFLQRKKSDNRHPLTSPPRK